MKTIDPPIIIKKTKRKSLALEIKDEGLVVRAPSALNDKVIHSWVESKQVWIRQKWQSHLEQLNKQPVIKEGGYTYFRGKRYTLRFSVCEKQILIRKTELIIPCHEADTAKKLLKQWYLNQAKDYIGRQVIFLAEKMGLSSRIQAIHFRKTKTKWGHCTSSGELQFNWLLMMMPLDVIGYVAVHELCHLQEMNHSRRFWSLVSEYCPDYLIHKAWIKENGRYCWLDI